MRQDHTDSVATDARSQAASWALIVSLDCQDLDAWPQRFSLKGVTELSICRGDRRRLAVARARAPRELPQSRVSETHARRARSDDRWTIEDAESKNGTRVNGRRVSRAALADGDVIECGGTFLVLRRTDAAADRLELDPGAPEALRTLSPTLAQQLELLRKLAASEVPLLVLGESGTGKEGTVRVIHELSGRSGPLVAVNCGAIPVTLIEGELFGSRRGAFSGAADRVGLVRSAHKGTLFLDEVAELPLASQVALLRVLQEKELLPLGSTQAVEVDVRVVAATNRPVSQLVEQGKLRRDLYARLRGYELRLLPLRERLEDMGLLVSALIRRHDKGGGPRRLSRTAAGALFAHDWPLNIRELELSLASALALGGADLRLEHLPEPVRQAREGSNRAAADDREQLLATIARLGGNMSAVARELGTSRTQLYRLLARHSIPLATPAPRKSPP